MSIRTFIKDIPVAKLIASSSNVRRTGRGNGVEELAASIAAHGLLQSLVVRPVKTEARGNKDDERFEVIGGGRRLAALQLLIKRKQMAKAAAVPCVIRDDEAAEELSLAENVVREHASRRPVRGVPASAR